MSKSISAVCSNIVERVVDLDLPIELDLGMLRSAIRKHGKSAASAKIQRLATHLDKAIDAHNGETMPILAAVVTLSYAIREGCEVSHV